MKETVVEKYLRTQCLANGFLCYKFVSPANRGVPDRIIIGHGFVFFVELKAPGCKPRRLQEVVIERIKNHGAEIFVIDSKEGVDELLKEFLTRAES